MEVVNIFCLTHCLLCSSQNVFLHIQTTVFVFLSNIQKKSSQIISTSYLSQKRLSQDYGYYFPIYCCDIFMRSRFCCLTTVEICKQFLASKISFCLLYLRVFCVNKNVDRYQIGYTSFVWFICLYTRTLEYILQLFIIMFIFFTGNWKEMTNQG